MDNQEKRKKIRRRSKKRAVIMLAAATAVIWLLILLVKIILAHANGESVDFGAILDGIGDNILGILPPLILIDFAFESVTQDYVSEEISEQITGTLMSNPETIRLFDDETKRSFLNATISTLATHGPDEEEMAISAIAPYVKSQYNLRKNFDYNITLLHDPISDLFDAAHYITVKETLSYSKHYIATDPLGSTFHIGFFASNSDLDKHLRGQDFLFREGLTIRPEELEKLSTMTDAQKREFVTQNMQLTVTIERHKCQITDVAIDSDGIIVAFHSEHDPGLDTLFIKTAFCMPQLKTEKTFLVSISEPAYDVSIRFDYPRSTHRVEMYPFFGDSGDALVEDSNFGVGSYEICIRDKWVYPMSGIVFAIEPKA